MLNDEYSIMDGELLITFNGFDTYGMHKGMTAMIYFCHGMVADSHELPLPTIS
jgi:hypothetical protein